MPSTLQLLDRSLSTLPIMVCNRVPTPPTSDSGYWTSSRRSTDSSQTSIGDKLTFMEEEPAQPDPSDLRVPDLSTFTQGDTTPGLHVQPATRPTLPTTSSNNPALDANWHPSTKKPPSVDSNRCLAIIEGLRVPSLVSQTFDDVSPEEFDRILTLAERRTHRVSAKLIYEADLRELVAMPAPYPIHQAAIRHMDKRVSSLLEGLLPNKNRIFWDTHPNSALEDETSALIPDLFLELRSVYPTYSSRIAFWVGECGFSSTKKQMERQLALAASIDPGMDVGFMISIREAAHVLPPPDHPLNCLPVLAFTPPPSKDPLMLEPIVTDDITWLEVKSVGICVFLRGPDGHFNFNDPSGPLFAQGWLFPEYQMEEVDNMLDEATQRLIQKIIQMMEAAGDEPDEISELRTTHASFPTDWLGLLQELRVSMCDTAQSRYFRWLRTEQPKRKRENPTPQQSPLSKRPAPSVPSKGTSQETTSKKRTRKRKGKQRK